MMYRHTYNQSQQREVEKGREGSEKYSDKLLHKFLSIFVIYKLIWISSLPPFFYYSFHLFQILNIEIYQVNYLYTTWNWLVFLLCWFAI